MNVILAMVYAGFFVVDLRLILISLGLSLLSSTGTVLLARRVTSFKAALPWIGAGVVLYELVFILFLDLVLNYPVFEIRSFFPVP